MGDDLLFVGEIGINASGNIEDAFKLIDMAKECGCDAVKFQKRDVDTVYTKEFLDSPRESPWGTTQRAQKEGLEFTHTDYVMIDDHCFERDIDWFASAWDTKSQEFLSHFNLKYNKIASAMLTHKDLVKMVADEGKHTFISTGMSNFKQIDDVVGLFRAVGCPFTILHCVSVYPCRDEWCNVRMVQTLKERYDCPVGYSGHELGILPSVLAVSLGASVIERHITSDRSGYGSDQSASLEKEGLSRLIRDCKDVHKMLGDGHKAILPQEDECAAKLRYWA